MGLLRTHFVSNEGPLGARRESALHLHHAYKPPVRVYCDVWRGCTVWDHDGAAFPVFDSIPVRIKVPWPPQP